MSDHYRFGIVAGEKSGDILGASLISALRDYFPNATIHGIDIGTDCLFDEERLKTFIFDSTDWKQLA